MRLLYTDSVIDLEVKEGTPVVVVIENKRLFTSFIYELWKQIAGESGKLILSDCDKEYIIEKNVELIINPFSLDFNNKKIITSVFNELKNIVCSEYSEVFISINSQIVDLLDELELKVDYPLLYNMNPDIQKLLKLYDVKVEQDCEDLLEYVVAYIKLIHRVNGINIVVFVNIKSYFNSEDIKLLYQECLYENVLVIDIESNFANQKLDIEQYYIIDKDLCLIQL